MLQGRPKTHEKTQGKKYTYIVLPQFLEQLMLYVYGTKLIFLQGQTRRDLLNINNRLKII